MESTKEREARQKLYFDGDEVEVWENPDAHFGASPAGLKAYFNEGSWVALFNAMTLTSQPDSCA